MDKTEMEPVSMMEGDVTEFVDIVRNLVMGVVRESNPKRLYLVRIDNWFGPRWMHFAGKFTAGKGFAIGIHNIRLHVPPFVPHRVVAQEVFVGPRYKEKFDAPPLHVECTSKEALTRRIGDIDKDGAFVWFSGASEGQKRGSVMAYLPFAVDENDHGRVGFRRAGAFYAGFSQREKGWGPAMLRGISRSEVAYLKERGRDFGRALMP